MAYHWLQINRPCVLEIPQLQDYGGQPLVFKAGLQKRCVTEAVFNDPLVQAYLAQLLLVEVGADGLPVLTHGKTLTPPMPVAPTVTPVVIAPIAAPVIAEPEPVVPVVVEPVAPVIVEPEPVVPVIAELVAEPVSEPESLVTETVEDTAKVSDEKGFEVKRRRR